MKHLSYILLGAAGLILSSCANEDLVAPGSDGDTANVTINLSTPQISSRAFSDGTTATNLQYAVYLKEDDNLTYLPAFTKTDAEIALKTQVSFQLVRGNTYTFVFWAGSPDANKAYTVDFGKEGASLTVNYNGIQANKEVLDAFCTSMDYTVTGDASIEAHLYRPFAQINVGTNDYEAAAAAGYSPTKSHIKISNVYKNLDLISGEVTNPTEYEYTYAGIPQGETFPVAGYDYMAMTYALVDKEQEIVEVDFDVKDANNVVHGDHKVGSVPVQRNYRTNIYGALITSMVDLNVIIEPAFEDEYNYEMVAPGVEYKVVDGVETFYISTPEGLSWISEQVNGFGFHKYVKTEKLNGYNAQYKSFCNQTIILENDLDMADIDWKPIGYALDPNPDDDHSIYGFAGIFNGNNKKISNLTVKLAEDNRNAGLFGSTNDAIIKDLTLLNVNIHGHYKTGAIVGDGTNVVIENCHVIGGTITVIPWEKKSGVWDDANNVGGIVGYLNGQPRVSSIKNCSVKDLKITAFRKVGGIVGVITNDDDESDGKHTSSVEVSGNNVVDTQIIADMSETRYDKWESRVAAIGEIFGSDETPARSKDRTTIESNNNNNVTTTTIKAKVSSDNDLAESVKTPGVTVIVEGGNYGPLNGTNIAEGVTIICEEGTVFEGISNLNMKGSTIEGATFKFYGGNASSDGAIKGNINGNFNRCNFEGYNGSRWAYAAGEEVRFTDCNFAGTAIYAIHIDSSAGGVVDPHMYFESCSFDGFVALSGANVTYQFDNCEFHINSSSKYGGGNFYSYSIFNNCKFFLPIPKKSFQYICLAKSGQTFEFNNCTNNGEEITADFDFAAESGAIVKINGVETVL